ALWKGTKPGEPAWESPWGLGRPGWHIECSAMSMKILGETFDIHGGGQDLIFPHHENEIAQSEAATGKPFARYWMHNGYINVNNQKMSKSLNNFFTVRDIAKEFDLEAVRLFMLGAQYRTPVNFSREQIEQATAALTRLRTAKERLDDAMKRALAETSEADTAFEATLEKFKADFCAAMDDDLNTADALAVLFDFARALNTFVTEPRGKAILEKAAVLYGELTGVLGLLVHKQVDDTPAEALELLERRQAARKAKDWPTADAIRDQLKAMGYAIEDSREGAKLKKL
ncbi:MAG: class I tRNA ligase family protein, partial [Clostridia bacterium]|nr:class I tRNA ligase family protein [Clostridia bacterium]